jgi:uncharacterized membrane protein YbhN (UPF0104 family)
MAESKRSRTRWPLTAARAIFSCAALLWVLHATPLHTIVATLRTADLLLLIIGMALNLLTRLAAAERTQVISRALGLFVSRWQTIEALFISNFYALLSPGPVLSGVVTVYRYRRYGASITGSVGSLLASRAVECATFIALGTACVLIDTRVSLISVQYPLALALAALLPIFVGISCWWLIHRRWTRRVAQDNPSPGAGSGVLTKVRAVWREIMSRGPSMVWHAAVPATMQVLLSGAAVSVLARSLGIELSLLTATWISAAVYAVVLLPISVAGLGVREVTLVKALGLLGVAPRLAVALSVLLFLDPLVNALIGGLLQLRSAVGGAQKQA